MSRTERRNELTHFKTAGRWSEASLARRQEGGGGGSVQRRRGGLRLLRVLRGWQRWRRGGVGGGEAELGHEHHLRITELVDWATMGGHLDKTHALPTPVRNPASSPVEQKTERKSNRQITVNRGSIKQQWSKSVEHMDKLKRKGGDSIHIDR